MSSTAVELRILGEDRIVSCLINLRRLVEGTHVGQLGAHFVMSGNGLRETEDLHGTRALADVELLQNEYAEWIQLCGSDDRLPSSWDGWQAMQESLQHLVATSVPSSSRLHVTTDQFERWCCGVNVHPCLDALRAFVIAKRHGSQNVSSNAISKAAAALHSSSDPLLRAFANHPYVDPDTSWFAEWVQSANKC